MNRSCSRIHIEEEYSVRVFPLPLKNSTVEIFFFFALSVRDAVFHIVVGSIGPIHLPFKQDIILESCEWIE